MPNYTKNYNLKKPTSDEFYNVDDNNGNTDIIDQELKDLGDRITTNDEADAAHWADETAHGIGDKSTLATTDKTTLVGAINEAFQFANNGKMDIASVIGSPATSGDTFAQLKTHIQNRKNDLATSLTAKGQSSIGTETLKDLVDKVSLVSTGPTPSTGTKSVIASVKNGGTTSISYTPIKRIQVAFSGTISVSFGLFVTGAITAYGKLYKNGIAIGIERTNASNVPAVFTENITVENGDVVELYMKSNNGSYAAYTTFMSINFASNPLGSILQE